MGRPCRNGNKDATSRKGRMQQNATEVLKDDAGGVARAAALLASGALVAFPTETVYGLGANATDDRAVARIYEAKGRPSFNPLIVHVPDAATAARYVVFDDVAKRLAEAFWPGALTLVLPLREGAGVSRLVTAGNPSLAVRVPDHALAQKLLLQAGVPVAAPSANPSGRISPTTAAHVLAGLHGRIDAVLDGGACVVGLESTIVGVEHGNAVLLRPGGLPVEAVEDCLGASLGLPDGGVITAPGQLASHYAPGAAVRLNAVAAEGDEFLIGFGEVEGDVMLSRGDLVEAAARLFDVLHKADETGRPIAVAPVPKTGLGRAINDRLRRASAPRG